METFGRKTLYSSLEEKDLNAETILKTMESVLQKHETNRFESAYLRDYYIGKQDIRQKQKFTREEINNKATENWAYAITEFVKSFLLSEPIQYVQSTDGTTEEVVKLNKYMAYENKNFKDSDLLEDIVLTGRAYRYIAPDEAGEEDEAPFEIQNIRAEDCEVVYYSGIGHKQLFAFVETKMGKVAKEVIELTQEEIEVWKTYSIYTVYTKDRVFKYTNENGNLEYLPPREPKDEVLFPAGHRIIEYYFNKSRLSLIEVIKPLLDKINQLESLDMDDMEQFVNAMMVFKNANITEETIAQGKELGALLLKSDNNQQADVSLLQGRLQAADTQKFYERLLGAMLSIIAMPFANDNGSYGDTGVARMTGQGWTMADQRSNTLISAVIMSEREVLKYVLKICKNKNSEIKNLRVSDLEVRFRVNKNANILEKTQALLNMKTAQIAPSVAIPTCKIFSDDQNAILESSKYYGDNFWASEEKSTSEPMQDIQKQNNELQDIQETTKQKGV